MISLNRIYGFTFHPDFTTLDGVYEVRQIISYDEIVLNQIDMEAFLYGKVGKTIDDYDLDKVNYTEDSFYQLRDASDEETIIYVPRTLIPNMPEPNLKQYNKMVLSVNLGLFGNLTSLDSLITKVAEVVSTNEGVVATPEVMIYGKEWKTDTEYEAIEAARAAAAGAAVNYYSETVRLTALLAERDAKIEALEAIIVASQP